VDDAAFDFAASLAGVLGAFALPAMTVWLPGHGVDRVVLCALVLVVAASGIAAGRTAALSSAAMAGLSYDFFRVAPIRVLHPLTLAAVLALMVAVALVSTARQRSGRYVQCQGSPGTSSTKP